MGKASFNIATLVSAMAILPHYSHALETSSNGSNGLNAQFSAGSFAISNAKSIQAQVANDALQFLSGEEMSDLLKSVVSELRSNNSNLGTLTDTQLAQSLVKEQLDKVEDHK